MRILLQTVHGSRLYGLSHEDSDNDMFYVVPGDGRAKHNVEGRADDVTVPLERFLRNANSGSHQSVEALFSPYAVIDPEYRALFKNMRITGGDVFEKYRRTIHKFSHGNRKKRQHAVRLAFNLRGLREEGRFNPVLSEEEIFIVRESAKLLQDERLYRLCEMLSTPRSSK